MKRPLLVATTTLSLFAGISWAAESQPAAEKSAAAPAADKPAAAPVVKPQTTCPVMGEAIDKSFYVDYEGKRIYFCCGGCPETFKKKPAKYLAKLQREGVTLAAAPTNAAPAAATAPAAGGSGSK